MRELTILNNNKKSLTREAAMSSSPYKMVKYKIESKNFGPFGPTAAFTLNILDKNDKDVLLDLASWRASPLYRAYKRFDDFNVKNPDLTLDVGFALKALLKHPFAEFKTAAFRNMMIGEACNRNEEAGQIIINKSALKALVSAVRPAVEYAYYKGDQEQRDFWHEIFEENGASYSDGMIGGTFGCGGTFVKPSLARLQTFMPQIERAFYTAE